MTNEIAERYAQGLFELAKDEGTVEEKKKQAETIIETMNDCPDFDLFLRAVKVTKEEKKDLIARVFKDAADHDMISFMKLIVDKGRSFYLRGILETYIKLANEDLGIETAVVVSARKLSSEDLQIIGEALVRKTKKKVVLRNKIDPSVISGIKVIIGNTVTDATMATKIEKMRSTLLKGGQA